MLQLSATFLIVVTSSVFALAPPLADVPPAEALALPEVPLASALLPEAFESGVCDFGGSFRARSACDFNFLVYVCAEL
jgi:hypothetical protein